MTFSVAPDPSQPDMTYRVSNGHPAPYPCGQPGMGQNAYMAMHNDNDVTGVTLMRMDGGAWDWKGWGLQDMSFCKDRDGTTDLMIGVSGDRRSIYIVNLSTGAWEDAGVYDSYAGDHGSLNRPTMANGHTIMVNATGHSGSITDIPIVFTFERGGTNVQLMYSYIWNATIAPDGAWFLGTACGSNWGGSYQGQYHIELVSGNVTASAGQPANFVWMTFPSDNPSMPDCDQGNIGQWSNSYGSYETCCVTGNMLDTVHCTWRMDWNNTDTWPDSDIAIVAAIWAPVGDPSWSGTWHMPGERLDLFVNNHAQGFWVGNPTLVYPSIWDEEHAGDPGWVTYKFTNPWGSGINSVCYVPGYRGINVNGNHSDMGIAVGGDRTKAGWNVQGHYVMASDWANYKPSWLTSGYYYTY